MKDQASSTRRALFTTEARRRSALCSLQFVGSVLVAVGFFGPWVAHRTAALTVTGYELSEFAKFFPEVQSGAVPVRRGLFVTPLVAAVVSLALVIHRSDRSLPLRLMATALTALVGLAVLPPLQAILEPQYRLQLIVVAGGLLPVIVAPLTRHASERVRGLLTLLVALVGVVPALWQVILLRPLVAALYERAIWPGWGFIACMVGFVALLVAGLRSVARS